MKSREPAPTFMPYLTPPEKVELGAIVLVTALTGWLSPRTGVTLELGVLVAGAALLVLLQGFGRDLWLLREARRAANSVPGRTARCMCIESAMGLTGVVAGIALTGFGLTKPVQLSAAALTVAVGATMIAGYLLKDFVFEWFPWRIYREKNHAQVIFRWR
jgi:hypothetical protein